MIKCFEDRVLIVEDYKPVHTAMQEMLEIWGYSVHVAETNVEALSLALSKDFTVMIFDYLILDGPTIDTVLEIQKHKSGVYFYANSADLHSNKELLEAGCHESLSKDFNKFINVFIR